jgi:hypothetical protein
VIVASPWELVALLAFLPSLCWPSSSLLDWVLCSHPGCQPHLLQRASCWLEHWQALRPHLLVAAPAHTANEKQQTPGLVCAVKWGALAWALLHGVLIRLHIVYKPVVGCCLQHRVMLCAAFQYASTPGSGDETDVVL